MSKTLLETPDGITVTAASNGMGKGRRVEIIGNERNGVTLEERDAIAAAQAIILWGDPRRREIFRQRLNEIVAWQAFK